MLRTIDHVVLPVSTLEAAAPFERIGISLTPSLRHAGQGTENRVFFTGSAAGEFYVELLRAFDKTAAVAAMGEQFAPPADGTPGLQRVVFACEDIDGVRVRLESAGIGVGERTVSRDDGTVIGRVLQPKTNAAGCSFGLIDYAEPPEVRLQRHGAAGLYQHAFPLKRLDHLAVIVHDLAKVTSFWTDVLGVPVFGEVPRPGSLIRQMKVGDAVLELIGPTEPNSPMLERPQGVASMCAFEVTDMGKAIDLARAAGFTCPDAAPGPLPGTRVTTIPGAELAGLGLQLLEYV